MRKEVNRCALSFSTAMTCRAQGHTQLDHRAHRHQQDPLFASTRHETLSRHHGNLMQVLYP